MLLDFLTVNHDILGDFLIPFDGVFLERNSDRLVGVFAILELAIETFANFREAFKLKLELVLKQKEF